MHQAGAADHRNGNSERPKSNHDVMLSNAGGAVVIVRRLPPAVRRELANRLPNTVKAYSAGQVFVLGGLLYRIALAQAPENLRMTQRCAYPAAAQDNHCRQHGEILLALHMGG